MALAATPAPTHPHAGVVYIDGWHALVARSTDGHRVTDLVRTLESSADFLSRVARAADDCDCLVILGPDHACRDLEREFEVLYQRPHLFDVEAVAEARPDDVLERLRVLESLGGF
jgi:hypothetical protein